LEAAAAAQRKGSEIGDPSWRHDAGGKSPLQPRDASVSIASEPKSAAVNPPLLPRAKWKDMREGPMYMKEVFEELLEESKANAEMGQKDDPEGTAVQKEQVRFLDL
jgi:hypothetical protein